MPDITIITCPPCFHCGDSATIEVLTSDYLRYKAGALAQQAFPEMPRERREMLITGTHPACWDVMFAEEDEG